jgi:hypothetical protein
MGRNADFTFILQTVVLFSLFFGAFATWRREKLHLETIANYKEAVEIYESKVVPDLEEARNTQARLEAAIAQIRALNGDKAVVLPNADGTVYIDKIEPGEKVRFGVAFPLPEEKEPGF